MAVLSGREFDNADFKIKFVLFPGNPNGLALYLI